MNIKVSQGIEYTQVLINGDSLNIFEYEKTAFEFLEEQGDDFDGEVVEVYHSRYYHLSWADVDEEDDFMGYGVLTHDDWGDPVLL